MANLLNEHKCLLAGLAAQSVEVLEDGIVITPGAVASEPFEQRGRHLGVKEETIRQRRLLYESRAA